jgi:hypothetical protein
MNGGISRSYLRNSSLFKRDSIAWNRHFLIWSDIQVLQRRQSGMEYETDRQAKIDESYHYVASVQSNCLLKQQMKWCSYSHGIRRHNLQFSITKIFLAGFIWSRGGKLFERLSDKRYEMTWRHAIGPVGLPISVSVSRCIIQLAGSQNSTSCVGAHRGNCVPCLPLGRVVHSPSSLSNQRTTLPDISVPRGKKNAKLLELLRSSCG